MLSCKENGRQHKGMEISMQIIRSNKAQFAYDIHALVKAFLSGMGIETADAGDQC